MSISALRQTCQPAHKQATDPLMEWYLLRPVSIYLTWLFVRLRLRANQVSFLGWLLAATGGVFLLMGDRQWALIGATCIWLSFLMDCVDGEVSRYRQSSSVSGTYLDYLVGGVNDVMIFVCLAFHVSAVTGWDPRLVVVPSAVLAAFEKLVRLYVHSVVFRNCPHYWDAASSSPEADREASDEKVWFKMSLPQRLLRVPFETFFRVTLILLAMITCSVFGTDVPIVAAWALIVCLAATLAGKALYSELFRGRVERTMENFIRALKSRVDDTHRVS